MSITLSQGLGNLLKQTEPVDRVQTVSDQAVDAEAPNAAPASAVADEVAQDNATADAAAAGAVAPCGCCVAGVRSCHYGVVLGVASLVAGLLLLRLCWRRRPCCRAWVFA